jgi:uncharacterized protein YdeI (YjbR/CyaY-like superfamily)
MAPESSTASTVPVSSESISQFVVWIHTAKRPQTRKRRIRDSIQLLAAGKELALK